MQTRKTFTPTPFDRVVYGLLLASVVFVWLVPTLYFMVASSGPFQWFKELELRYLGSWSPKTVMGFNLIACGLLAVVYAATVISVFERLRGSPSAPVLSGKQALIAAGGAAIVTLIGFGALVLAGPF